jgi:hypothetical protein
MHPTRKTQRRAGKDSIAASQGQDDVVNAVAGCAAALHNKFYDPFMGCGDDDDPQYLLKGDLLRTDRAQKMKVIDAPIPPRR